MNATMYARVSGASQTDGDGFPRQCEKGEAYAAEHNLTLDIVWFEDVSGTKDKDSREVFAAMLDWMQANNRTLLLVEGAHRFARDLFVQELAIMDLQKAGITVIEVEGGNNLCDDNPTKTLIRQVLGAVSEYEKKMLVSKLKAARDRIKRRTGKCDGSKAYGERKGDDPEVIERIVKEKREWRLSFRRIAERLNRDEVPTQRGGKWHRSTVRQIYRRAVA